MQAIEIKGKVGPKALGLTVFFLVRFPRAGTAVEPLS